MFPGGYHSLGHNFGHWNCFFGPDEIAKRRPRSLSGNLRFIQVAPLAQTQTFSAVQSPEETHMETGMRTIFFGGLRWFKYIQYVKILALS